MGENLLLHVGVGVFDGDLDRVVGVFDVEVGGGLLHQVLFLLEEGLVVVPDEELHFGVLHVALDGVQVEKALVALGELGHGPFGQQGAVFHGHGHGVYHLALGGAGVDAQAGDLHGGRGGVEVFVLQLAQEAAVHGIGEVAAKALYVEVVGAGADLLIGGEAQLDGAVGLVLPDNLRGGAEDLRHAGLVVAAQEGGAVGGDEGFALLLEQGGEIAGGQGEAAGAQGDVTAVVVFDDLGVDVLPGDAAVGVHVGDEAHGGVPLRCGGDGAVDIAGVVHVGVGDAHGFHQADDVGPQDFLARGAGDGGAGLVGSGAVGDQVEKGFFDGHGWLPRFRMGCGGAVRLRSSSALSWPGRCAWPPRRAPCPRTRWRWCRRTRRP